jgi:hypothetical protein
MMNFFDELMRIADKTVGDDAAILRAAAIQLAPKPVPNSQTLREIPGCGYLYTEVHAPNVEAVRRKRSAA